MSDDFYARAQLAKLRADALCVEARTATLERRVAIAAEMDVIYASVVAIREEQLISQLAPPKRAPWWMRLLGRGGDAENG